MDALLDTSALINFEGRARETGTAFGPLLASWLQERLGPEEEIAIAAIAASELVHGVHRATAERRSRREAFVEATQRRYPLRGKGDKEEVKWGKGGQE